MKCYFVLSLLRASRQVLKHLLLCRLRFPMQTLVLKMSLVALFIRFVNLLYQSSDLICMLNILSVKLLLHLTCMIETLSLRFDVLQCRS